MFVLGDVAALDVAEGGVGLHDAHVAEVLERAQVLLLSALGPVQEGRPAVWSLQPPPAWVGWEVCRSLRNCGAHHVLQNGAGGCIQRR